MKLMRRKGLLISVGLSIFVAIVLTILGLIKQPWPEVLPIGNWGLHSDKIFWKDTIKFFFFLLGCSFLIAFICDRTHRQPSLITLGISIVIGVLAGGTTPLLAILLYGLASLALGDILFNLLRINSPKNNNVNKLLLGLGIYATFISISAHYAINYSSVYLIGLLLPIFFKHRWLWEFLRSLTHILLKSFQPRLKDWPTILLSTLFVLHFSCAFLPEVGFDALAMHLFIPTHVAVWHQWGFDSSLYTWTFMPMLGDWNFTMGYLIAGEVGARLINVMFIFILAYLGRELVLWAGGNEKGAIWSMLIFLATPLTFTESSSLFIESIWASYVIAGTLSLSKFISEDKHRASYIILAALMLGLATASKAITLIYLPLLFLPILYHFRLFTTREQWYAIFKGISYFSVLGGIPYLIAYIKVGNPIFPFYNTYFKSSFYPSAVNFDNEFFKAGPSWDMFYQIIFFSEKYMEGSMGVPGFQWLILLIPAISLIVLFKKKRAIGLLLLSTLALALLFHFISYLRYAFPIFLLLSVVIGVALSFQDRLGKYLKGGIATAAVFTLCLNLAFFSSGVWLYRDIPVWTVFNKASQDKLVVERMPIRKAVELINLLNDKSSPVAFLSAPTGAGLKADALYFAWYNQEFLSRIDKVDSPSSLAKTLKNYGAEYVILDSSWGSKPLRDIVEKSTQLIANFGPISVRIINKDLV